jgi:ferric-dicitrate binding protein FerR (iron transport regulator)
MKKSYFFQLLIRYSDGTVSEEERQFLFSYYKLFDAEPDVLSTLSEKKRKHLKNQIQNSIWEKIDSNEKKEKKGGNSSAWSAKLINVILLLLFCATGIVCLSLEIEKQSSVVVRFKPWEQNRMVPLPDGSIILLNSSSEIHYPSSFNHFTKREVHLEEQAFFDVKHDPKKPFTITTGNIKSTVPSTAFNIQAYPAEEDILTTVTRGRVKIADQYKAFWILYPKDRLIYNKETSEAVRQIVKTEVDTNWKQQNPFLKDVALRNASMVLEKKFNMIIYEDEYLLLKPFTTPFFKEENQKQLLKCIC